MYAYSYLRKYPPPQCHSHVRRASAQSLFELRCSKSSSTPFGAPVVRNIAPPPLSFAW